MQRSVPSPDNNSRPSRNRGPRGIRTHPTIPVRKILLPSSSWKRSVARARAPSFAESFSFEWRVSSVAVQQVARRRPCMPDRCVTRRPGSFPFPSPSAMGSSFANQGVRSRVRIRELKMTKKISSSRSIEYQV